MLEYVSAADDPRLADYRDVPKPELVRRRGLFVAEGRLVVRRLLESTRFATRSVLMNQAALAALQDVIDARRDDLEVLVAATETLVTTTGFNFHRGCLAIGERLRAGSNSFEDLELDRSGSSVVLVLDGIANADNVGVLFRNAAAFGATAVLLTPECCDPLYRKALRTSMGTILQVPFARTASGTATLERLRTAGYRIVALTARRDRSTPIGSVDALGSRVALLVGAESRGLDPALEAAADDRVTIPIASDVDSLNVAVATGIALYRLSEWSG